MSTTQREQTAGAELVSSHLTVRPETDGPREVRFMFDQPESQRIGRSLGAGLATELVVIGLVLLVMSLMPKRVYQAVLPDRLAEDIVWLSQPGPGGGGGGGNKMPDPPKKAELKGEQKISVPTPPEPTPQPLKEEPPVEQLNIPAQTLAAAPVVSPGALSPNPNDTASTGSGSGTGAGSGQGSCGRYGRCANARRCDATRLHRVIFSAARPVPRAGGCATAPARARDG
jgi:hypothetical protein